VIPNGESWPWITDLMSCTDLTMKELRVMIYEDDKAIQEHVHGTTNTDIRKAKHALESLKVYNS
jgi:hypothetical protein